MDVPNYILPDTTTVFFLNGNFLWLTPQITGAYVFTVRVNEYRNTTLVGSTIVDFQLIVYPPVSQSEFNGISTWLTDTSNNYSYTISPQDSLELILSYTDVIDTAISSINLKAYSETFINGNTATFSSDSITATFQRKKYKSRPNSLNPRCAPYIITFRGESTMSELISKDISVMIFVRDSSLSYCDALISQLNTPIIQIPHQKKELIVNVFPNPFSYQTTISIETNEIPQRLTFTLFDLYGNKILNNSFFDSPFTLNKNKLVAGFYFYKIENELGQVAIGKIVVN
jgi:hypothetical protein